MTLHIAVIAQSVEGGEEKDVILFTWEKKCPFMLIGPVKKTMTFFFFLERESLGCFLIYINRI